MVENAHVKIMLLGERSRLPEYGTVGSAGADLFAAFDDPEIGIAPGERAVVPIGIALEIPAHTEAQIRPRSGLAAKHGITVLNTPGTIDSDYRGEIKVILYNTSREHFTVSGDKIAQIVFAPVLRAQFDQASELLGTVRGAGGFGSTGQ